MNMEAGSAESPAATGAAPNLIQRVMMVFLSPAKLGEALRQASPWFWTLLIVAVVAAVVLYLVPPDVWRATLEAQARAAQQPGGGQQPDPDTVLGFARIGGSIGALIVPFIAALVMAGVLYLTFNVMFGQDTTYKQHLSAAAHIYWINTLGFLVVVPIWISKGDMLTQLGLGLLLQDAPRSFVGHLLNSITIFGLWSAFALGSIEAGLSGGRVTAGKAVGTVLALYFVWVLFNAARATLFGA
jgi:hypothetical protein